MEITVHQITLTALVTIALFVICAIAFSLVKYERVMRGYGIHPQDYIRLSIARRLQVGSARGEFFLLWIRLHESPPPSPSSAHPEKPSEFLKKQIRTPDECFELDESNIVLLVDASIAQMSKTAARIRSAWAAQGWPAFSMASAAVPGDGLNGDALLASAQVKIAQRTGDPASATPPAEPKKEAVELTPAEQKLIDPATGVLRPQYALLMSRKFAARSHRHNQSVALVLAGIERWNEFKDTYGPELAARALKETASAIEHAIRESDLIGRVDERSFFALCECPPDKAGAIATRLCHAIEKIRIPVGPAHIQLIVNAGVALMPVHTHNASNLFWMADEARQWATKAGPNRWALYDPAQPRLVPKPTPTEPTTFREQSSDIF